MQTTPTLIRALCLCASLVLLTTPADADAPFDVVLRGGTVYDGSGESPRRADVGLRGDRIAAIGDLSSAPATQVLDASGMAVAPGFINMLSWATESLLVDGHAQSDIRQGVTLEIFGEGESMGPLNAAMHEEMLASQGDLKYPVTWTSLSGYLEHLEQKGVSPNVASFVGATTVRIHELGYANRVPDAQELARMPNSATRRSNPSPEGRWPRLLPSAARARKKPQWIWLSKTAPAWARSIS